MKTSRHSESIEMAKPLQSTSVFEERIPPSVDVNPARPIIEREGNIRDPLHLARYQPDKRHLSRGHRINHARWLEKSKVTVSATPHMKRKGKT